ncbi:HNH endonuclease [Nostoc sp.]|uniref:HNH endonuclease n=1 Tax=Nostoc sp. TaxID=1180 RepID=UPI002FFA4DD5
MKLKTFLADMLAALCRGFRPQQKNLRRHSRLSHHQKDRKRPHLIAKYGMRCFWCGCSLTRETMTIDHYIPLSLGGNNKIKNLRLACVRCNNFRGNSAPQETLEIITQRSNISFPTYWKTPKYSLGQQMKQGQIVGVEYDPPGTKTASDFGEKWTYWVLVNNDDIDTESFAEQSLEPMSLEDLQI